MYLKRIFLFLLHSLSSLAVIPIQPELKRYFSENGKYMLLVYPNQEKIDTEKSEDINDQCHAILFRLTKNDTIKIWKKGLVNRIMPLSAIVANNGKSIVTIDCYYQNRDGIDAMVIYGKDGKLKRRFDLEDFSPFTIEEYECTMIQTLWRCGVKFRNNREVDICFKKSDDIRKTMRYNIKTERFK